jgi:hypothetical protein
MGLRNSLLDLLTLKQLIYQMGEGLVNKLNLNIFNMLTCIHANQIKMLVKRFPYLMGNEISFIGKSLHVLRIIDQIRKWRQIGKAAVHRFWAHRFWILKETRLPSVFRSEPCGRVL